MNGKPCTLVLNTKWGYCMTPQNCNSIAAALKIAKKSGMAYRIFVGGKVVKRGWEA